MGAQLIWGTHFLLLQIFEISDCFSIHNKMGYYASKEPAIAPATHGFYLI